MDFDERKEKTKGWFEKHKKSLCIGLLGLLAIYEGAKKGAAAGAKKGVINGFRNGDLEIRMFNSKGEELERID